MRRTIAGLPGPARLMLGLATVALLAFVGGTFVGEAPLVGWAFIVMAGLRLLLWLLEARKLLRGGAGDAGRGERRRGDQGGTTSDRIAGGEGPGS